MSMMELIKRQVSSDLVNAAENGYTFEGVSDEAVASNLWDASGADYPALCFSIDDLTEAVRQVRLERLP